MDTEPEIKAKNEIDFEQLIIDLETIISRIKLLIRCIALYLLCLEVPPKGGTSG